jgi:hypothetical protein
MNFQPWWVSCSKRGVDQGNAGAAWLRRLTTSSMPSKRSTFRDRGDVELAVAPGPRVNFEVARDGLRGTVAFRDAAPISTAYTLPARMLLP